MPPKHRRRSGLLATALMLAITGALASPRGQRGPNRTPAPALSGSVRPVPTNRPELVLQVGHSGGVSSLAWRPDGKLLASSSFDRTIRLWDPASLLTRRVLRGHTDFVSALA
jgi:WD40 repeat protein